jgi:TolB-like protein/thioredoxin-like negative regulator of GroEL
VPTEQSSDVKFEIGHVLFIDIVAYSKLLITEQSNLLDKLKEIVRGTEQFRIAKAEGKLLAVPSGDGGALVFRNSPEAAALCAMEISEHLKNNPELRVRMGIHSGPVNEVTDVSGHRNVAGAGINMAQRVMDCGDAGHILLSKHVAEDLEQYPRWRPYLHQLGECEVKHGLKISIVNLVADGVGNAQPPQKFEAVRKHRTRVRWAEVAVAVLALGAIIAAFVLLLRRPSPESAVADKSIAVLPFENLSSEKENAYFSDGVQDEILTDLAKIADLKVISRSSVLQYKSGAPRNLREIGQQLGVAHLLEGSVQRAANKIRVNAQLVDSRNNAHVWAQSYDRDLADVFAIQSEIAKAIADQLQAKLLPSEKAAIEKRPTSDILAYDLYTSAKELVGNLTDPNTTQQKLVRAIALLQEAVMRDPQFVTAWCLLSRFQARMYTAGYDHTAERLKQAYAAIEAVSQHEPDAGEVHLALANYYYESMRDYGRASSELALAREKLPNDAEVFELNGYVQRRRGRWEEATRSLERAVELDPRNVHILEQLALTYQPQRRYENQARIYDRVLALAPDDGLTRGLQALVAVDWKADVRQYQHLMAELTATDPQKAAEADDINYTICERTPEAYARGLKHYPRGGSVNIGVNYPHAYFEGVVATCQGDLEKAGKAFNVARGEIAATVERDPEFAPAISFLGMIDAGLGRKQEALSEGHRACELLPPSKDAIDGVVLAVNLAQIYVWTGEKDLAIAQLAAVERFPTYLSYGLLKLQPIWDPLRGDPRFEQIVASLAPKDAASPTE